jgi:hypothetical protein
MDEPGVFLTPSELSVVNRAASCPDVSSGTAALRRIAATTQCSGKTLHCVVVFHHSWSSADLMYGIQLQARFEPGETPLCTFV